MARDEAFRKQFTALAEQVKTMSHQHLNILPIYDYGVTPQVIYIAMRLTSGQTLDTYMRENVIPPLTITARLMTQIGHGLGYAHEHGIIHYNLKPESILLDEADNVFLADFGIARRMTGEEVFSTKDDLQRGLSLYLSPEQLRGEPLTAQANVFSMGVILYRMVTGRMPTNTSSDNLTAIIQRHLTQPPPPPRSLNSDIPPALEDAILRALAKAPEARFPDVASLVNEINDALSSAFERPDPITMEMPAVRVEPQPDPDTDAPKTQRNLLGFASLGVTGVVVIFAIFIILFNPPVPISVIIENQSVAAAQLNPEERIINNARRYLGETGFIVYNSCNPLDPAEAARAAQLQQLAEQFGVRLDVYNSLGNPSGEIIALQQARQNGASAVIHCVIGETTVGNALAALAADDTPLVITSRALDVDGAVFLAPNEFALGEASGVAAGEYIQKQHGGTANVIVLDEPSAEDASERAQGLQAGLLRAAPEATILGVYPGAEADGAVDTLSELIGDEVNFDVILSVTDAGAYGAINALEFAGYLPHEVGIFSIGAELLAQRYMTDGRFIIASSRLNNEAATDAMFNATIELLGGGAVAEQILIPVEIITAETLDG